MSNGSKNQAQEASKTPSEPVPAPRGSRDRFWTDFWSPWDLKTHDFTREGRQKSRFSCLASGQQNRAQNGPKMSPKSTPKRLPEGQNVAQKRCWISNSVLSSIFGFLGSQKASQKATRIAQNPPSAPQGRPKASRDLPRRPPGSHFGLILGAPGAHFRAFQASFSKLARAPPHDRKHCSKSLPKGSFATAAGQMRTTPKAQWPVWGRRPTGDPATEPSGSLEAVSEAICRSRKHCDKHSFGEAQRLP